MSSTFYTVVHDLFASGVAVRFRASGDSMHPSIRCGDYVHVAPCAADSS